MTDSPSKSQSTVPHLVEGPWSAQEIASAEAFLQAMGEDGFSAFGKGGGNGKFLYCIRAALRATITEEYQDA